MTTSPKINLTTTDLHSGSLTDNIVKKFQCIHDCDAMLFKIDIPRAFWNIRIDPVDALKLSISWNDKKYIDISTAFGWEAQCSSDSQTQLYTYCQGCHVRAVMRLGTSTTLSLWLQLTRLCTNSICCQISLINWASSWTLIRKPLLPRFSLA